MPRQAMPDAQERNPLFGSQTLEQGRRGLGRSCSFCERGFRNGRNLRRVRGWGDGWCTVRTLENGNGGAHQWGVSDSQKIAGLKVGVAGGDGYTLMDNALTTWLQMIRHMLGTEIAASLPSYRSAGVAI